MRHYILLLVASLFIFSCDDGDVITNNITEFGDTFQTCGSVVYYKIKTDPGESLSVELPTGAALNNLIETTIENNIATLNSTTETFSLSSTNKFSFRTYNTDPTGIFCEDVPPFGIAVLSEENSVTGTATFTMTLVEDDNDGIPAELEDDNQDGDDNPATNPTDTDGDGIPNYLDADDDGDNVLTIDEDLNGDGDFTNDDTDLDETANYLDPDDDGDGVLTIDEENDIIDQDPTNDKTDVNNPDLEDYLNDAISTTEPATAYRQHTIQQTFTVLLTISDIVLQNLTQDNFIFGSLENSNLSDERTITPEFN